MCQASPPRTYASSGEGVGRRRRPGGAQSLQRVRPQIRAVEIERVARDKGPLKSQRHREAPAIRQEFVQPQRARHVRGVIGHIGRIGAELSELGVATGDVERKVGDVGRGDRKIECARGASLAHDIPQPDVVDPELRLVHEHRIVYPPDSGRDLLHTGQIGRRGAGIADVRDVWTITHHKRAVGTDERRVGAAGKDVGPVT